MSSLFHLATHISSFALCTTCSQEALTSFTEAVTRLCHGTDISLEQSSLPHLDVLKRDYRFLNAYEAEGLLGVCVYLIKVSCTS